MKIFDLEKDNAEKKNENVCIMKNNFVMLVCD